MVRSQYSVSATSPSKWRALTRIGLMKISFRELRAGPRQGQRPTFGIWRTLSLLGHSVQSLP